jgi:hypothetical protein
MKRKFSILITIKKDGTPSSTVYDKLNAQRGIDAFVKARADGIEAYLFMSPRADKRCRSEESRKQLTESTGGGNAPVVDEQDVKAAKAIKKTSRVSEGIADLE